MINFRLLIFRAFRTLNKREITLDELRSETTIRRGYSITLQQMKDSGDIEFTLPPDGKWRGDTTIRLLNNFILKNK